MVVLKYDTSLLNLTIEFERLTTRLCYVQRKAALVVAMSTEAIGQVLGMVLPYPGEDHARIAHLLSAPSVFLTAAARLRLYARPVIRCPATTSVMQYKHHMKACLHHILCHCCAASIMGEGMVKAAGLLRRLVEKSATIEAIQATVANVVVLYYGMVEKNWEFFQTQYSGMLITLNLILIDLNQYMEHLVNRSKIRCCIAICTS